MYTENALFFVPNQECFHELIFTSQAILLIAFLCLRQLQPKDKLRRRHVFVRWEWSVARV